MLSRLLLSAIRAEGFARSMKTSLGSQAKPEITSKAHTPGMKQGVMQVEGRQEAL